MVKTLKVTVLMTLVLLSCNTLQGHRGICSNIDESKRRGVFVSEYVSKSNPYVINDSLRLHIKSAWFEKQWSYPPNLDETIIDSGYQFIIHIDKEDMENYSRTWSMCIDDSIFLRRCAKDCLMMDCNSMLDWKVTWTVTQGRDQDSLKKVIGKLSLVRK
jgi:hypothetical protein